MEGGRKSASLQTKRHLFGQVGEGGEEKIIGAGVGAVWFEWQVALGEGIVFLGGVAKAERPAPWSEGK